MVPNIESDYILLLGYSILYKEYNLTRFNHQQTLLIYINICIYIYTRPIHAHIHGCMSIGRNVNAHLHSGVKLRVLDLK